MKDPARWRDPSGGADAETRALLLGGASEGPSSHERERIWSSLAPQVQALPAPQQAAPTATPVGSGIVLGKVTLAVVLAAGTGIGWYAVRSHGPSTRSVPEAQSANAPSERATTVAAPTVAPTTAPSVPAATPAARANTPPRGRRPGSSAIAKTEESRQAEPGAPLRAEPASVRPAELPQVARKTEMSEATAARIQPAGPPPQVVSNELLEEGRTLSRARAALRARDPAGALKLLQGAARTAALTQEREALTIEALAARPKSRAEAALRARTFVLAYPDSPYRARVKAVALENQ
jgi:hypothetical protein